MNTEILSKQATNNNAAYTTNATTRINLTDRNNEFNYLDVDDSGTVLGCHENHLPIWKGRMICLETCAPGEFPEYIDVRLPEHEHMNYRVKSVEPINRED